MAPQIEGRLIPVQRGPSALQEPSFSRHLPLVQKWQSTPPTPGTQMDSVFFHGDRFELIVDARGFRAEDLRCTVNPTSIQIACQRQEVSTGAQKSVETNRSYQLNQPIQPEAAVCCLSCEGFLLVVAPWVK